MNNHPITATLAAAVLIGGLATLVVAGVRNGSRAAEGPAHSQEEDERESLKRSFRTANILGRQGRFEEAKDLLRTLLENHPEEPGLWFNYGVALSALERYDEAEQAFEKTRELEPTNWDVLAELAALRKLQGQLDEALTLLEQIPQGEGRMAHRLRNDPLWTEVEDPRMDALVEKHVFAETSVRAKERGLVQPRD